MKVRREHMNRLVRITWVDPREETIHDASHPLARGKAALAIQVNNAEIDDVTDGVVRFWHNKASHPQDRNPVEISYTWVPEDLIEKIEGGGDAIHTPGQTPAA